MAAEDLDHLLLRRRQAVYVGPSDTSGAADGREPSELGAARIAEGLTALEAELARRGHLLTAPLRRALAALRPADLADRGKRLLAGVDELLGSDRTHLPLFRHFPERVPYGDAHSLFTTRVRAFLAARSDQPCMVCGRTLRVSPLRYCAHLVCGSCWDASGAYCCADCCEWFGCPVCDGRYETRGPASPWADPAGPGAGTAAEAAGERPDADTDPVLRVLRLAPSRTGAAREELATLLARRTPLNPQDHDDLRLLLDLTAGADDLGWLPPWIPLRESKALALHALLESGADAPAVDAVLRTRIDTATDVLRLLCVRSGGDPDLLAPPARMRGLPRPLRRLLLGVLDGLPFGALAEDLARHPALWKRAAEPLHPYEHAARHPRAALAFATLRGTRLRGGDPLAAVLRTEAARHPEHVRAVGDRLRAVTWGARVEEALAAYDVAGAAALLAARPGELLRRLDALLARAAVTGERELPGAVVDALDRALPRTAPGPLLGALGALRARTAEAQPVPYGVPPRPEDRAGKPGTRPGAKAGVTAGAKGGGTRSGPAPRRVFFPRGSVARAHSVPEERPPLPAGMVADACALLEGEVLERLALPATEPATPADAGGPVHAGAPAGADGSVRAGPGRAGDPVGADVPPGADLRAGAATPAGAAGPGHAGDRAGAEGPAEAAGTDAAARLAPYDLAVLDAGLAGLPLPAAERGSSAALVAIPRGSALPLPGEDGRLRLFLHWMQPRGTRVDLDLSVAMFDEDWGFLGLCDYTKLEYAGGAAVHSGDLTSAPPPHGATEYVDLDPARLARAGVRHLVTVVFSYNDVPFEELPDAFAGFLRLGGPENPDAPGGRGGGTPPRGARRTRGRPRRRPSAAPEPVRYDPRSVRQRFELSGDAKICVPLTVDLAERRARWTDVTLSSTGTGHDVWRYHNRLGALGRDLADAFGRGGRVTLWDLACWYAAARTRTDAEVCVRAGRDLRRHRRREGETTAAFAERLRTGQAPDAVRKGVAGPEEIPAGRLFTALVQGDLPGVPEGAAGTAYRLFPGTADGTGLRLVAPGDLVAGLAPRTV
ncbi:hypothetical protein [Streptomyces sp. JJ36]|uniref:hypothetical protein n=1 Tax=Streptomyces sp. JJ36 TaxID=2736645 RepID=UPI001F3A8FDB|nr:hypothetical protein [Streptomyces sp. JJ36]MCF6521530.1 hypothetical protein [Streptomyces sp. JJ36]